MDANRKEFDPLNVWSTNNNVNKIETITPHKIIVVFLVQEYLKVKSDSEKHGLYPPKYSKRFCMLLLKLIQYPDMSYKDLHVLLSTPHQSIDATHLRRFEELMETISSLGVDVLFDLQIFIGKLLTENFQVNQFGIVGFYIRRILLALNKMSFPDIIDLYKNINMYYDKGIRSMAFSTSATTLSDIDIDESVSSVAMRTDASTIQEEAQKHLSLILPPSTNSKERNGHSKWSVKQADLFIAQQSNLLKCNETCALKPVELQQRLNEISQDIPFYTQAHILSYMNSLRVRDFFNALDSFHCAYDRCATRANAAAVTAATDPNQTANSTMQLKNNKGLQYSSLNLAILHVQFGHYREALCSLRECVMLAQEAGDKVCLQLAQSWLCLLDKKYVLLCETSVTNQMENSAVHAVSLGVQFIVNVAAISGVLPSKLFELLMKSEVINFQHSLMDLVANCLSQKAAVWQQYGKTEIASLCNQLLLQVVRANKESDCIENSESVCLSLCCIAMWLSLQGEISQCAVVLQHASERFPRDPLSRKWLMTETYIAAQQGIYHCKWTDASRACSQLYMFDKTLCILQRSALNIARRNCIVAQKHLQTLLKDEQLEPINRIRAMILSINTYFRNDITATDISRFSAEVIGILNEASVYAKEKYLSYEAAIVDIHTTYVLLLMGMPQQALKLIRNCMETILANGGIYDCAKTQFLFVRCLVAAELDRKDKIARLCETLSILDECIQGFMKLEAYPKVKDIYIYLATFYDDVNMVPERNKWAYKFRDLEEQFSTPCEYLNVFF